MKTLKFRAVLVALAVAGGLVSATVVQAGHVRDESKQGCETYETKTGKDYDCE